MARAAGGEVMVRLMGEVAELRQELRAAQTDVKVLSFSLGSVIANVGCLRAGLDAMSAAMDSMKKRLDALEGKHQA